MKKSKDPIQRATDRLVERGFATRALIAGGVGHITWTDSGRELHRHVLHLFGVPKRDVGSVTEDEIMSVIGVLLHIEPSS